MTPPEIVDGTSCTWDKKAMVSKDDKFLASVHAVLERTRVRDLLASADAIVLERIARGAGATDWYYCSSSKELDVIEARLRPGSVISFYFDGRIRKTADQTALVADVEAIIAEMGDAVVGALGADGVEINMEVVVSRDDLAEVLSSIGPVPQLFYGAFPARDDDGMVAVTVTLPDADGIVRAHPH